MNDNDGNKNEGDAENEIGSGRANNDTANEPADDSEEESTEEGCKEEEENGGERRLQRELSLCEIVP